MGDAFFQQFFDKESSTYTYLLADSLSKEAAIIDPVIENADRDDRWIKDLQLKLKYIIDTHLHADHITGAAELRKRTGAQTAVSHMSKVECADILLKDGQKLNLGEKTITAWATPGHTDSCMCFTFENKVFTGDTLLIRGTGRTDFQQGSAETLYESIQNKLFTLPDSTLVYPAHDYNGISCSTIGLEKKFNPRIGGGKTKEQFVKIMSELRLSHPKKIHEALPANLACGQIQGSP